MADPFSEQQDVHIIEARGLGRHWLAAVTTRPEEAHAAVQTWRRAKPGTAYQVRARPVLSYPFAVIEPTAGGGLYYIQMLKDQKILNRRAKKSKRGNHAALCYIVESDFWNPDGSDVQARLEHAFLDQDELSRLLKLADFCNDCMTY